MRCGTYTSSRPTSRVVAVDDPLVVPVELTLAEAVVEAVDVTDVVAVLEPVVLAVLLIVLVRDVVPVWLFVVVADEVVVVESVTFSGSRSVECVRQLLRRT